MAKLALNIVFANGNRMSVLVGSDGCIEGSIFGGPGIVMIQETDDPEKPKKSGRMKLTPQATINILAAESGYAEGLPSKTGAGAKIHSGSAHLISDSPWEGIKSKSAANIGDMVYKILDLQKLPPCNRPVPSPSEGGVQEGEKDGSYNILTWQPKKKKDGGLMWDEALASAISGGQNGQGGQGSVLTQQQKANSVVAKASGGDLSSFLNDQKGSFSYSYPFDPSYGLNLPLNTVSGQEKVMGSVVAKASSGDLSSLIKGNNVISSTPQTHYSKQAWNPTSLLGSQAAFVPNRQQAFPPISHTVVGSSKNNTFASSAPSSSLSKITAPRGK